MAGKRRGFLPSIPPESQNEIFGNSKEIYINRKIVESSAKVFDMIAEKFSITRKCAYTTAKRVGERNGLIDKDSHVVNDSSNDYDFKWTDLTNSNIISPDKSLYIDIEQVKMFQEDFSQRKYVQGLNSVLRDTMWHFMKLPCCLNFNQMNRCGGEISMLSYCSNKQCKVEMLFRTENGRKLLCIECKGYNVNVKHKEKAYLTGEMKSKVLDMMKIDTPGQYSIPLNNKQIFLLSFISDSIFFLCELL